MSKRGGISVGAFHILAVFSIAAAAIVLAGCDDPHLVTSPHYRYGIHTAGIEGFTAAGGAARLLVPVPLYDHRPLLPFNGSVSRDLTNGSSWNWDQVVLNDWGFNVTRSLSVDTTQYWPMHGIEAQETGYFIRWESASPPASANMTPLGYGNYRYNKTAPAFDEVRVHITDVFGPVGSAIGNDTASALAAKPLYPDAGNTSTPYTLWIDGAKESNRSYTSYAYVDPALTGPRNGSFVLYATFEVIVGDRPYGGPGEHTVYVIRESIPSNVTGFVPVKVQYAGVFREYSIEDRWTPA